MSDSLRDLYVGIVFRDEASRAIENVDRSVDRVEHNVQGLGRRIDNTGDEFRSMGRVGMNAMNDIEGGLDDAEREARGFNRAVENSGDALGGLKRMAAGLGGIIAGAFAVDKIKDFATSGIELAANTKALNSQFGQVFGLMELTAEAKLNNIANQTGILPDRLKGSFSQIAAFAKTTGAETEEAMSLAERATLAAADSAAYQDRSIEDVTENLRSLLKGNFENDAALGISVTETTRNTKAMEMFNKKFKDLNELQKQDALLSMVEDSHKVTGAIGQAAREADGLENVTGNLNSAWNGLKGTMMTPFLEPLTDGMVSLTKKMQNVDAEQLGQKLKSGFDSMMDVAVPTFHALKDGLGWLIDNKDTIITVGSGLAAGFAVFKGLTFAKDIFNVVKGIGSIGLLSNPIGIAAVAIGGLVTAGVYLYKNWDKVKEKAGILKDNLSNAWQQIKDDVGGAIDQVGGFFTGLKEKAVGLWESIKENPMKLSMLGPIGMIIGAGMKLYQNWDTIKEKAGLLKDNLSNAWNQIKDNVSEKVSQVTGFFGSLKDGIVNTWTSIKDNVGNAVSQVVGFFDNAKERAIGLWETIKQNPMLLSVVGPIGAVIGAGMELYQNWDSIKGKAVELWTTTTEKFAGIKQSVSDFVEPAISWFETLGQKWNDFKSSLLNFEMPAWVSTVGDTIGGATSKVKSWVTGGPDGSHATGLERVGWNNYSALLHKDEAVLTAPQANAMRSAGILSANSDGTPNLDFSALSQQSIVTPTFNPTFNPMFEQPKMDIPAPTQVPVIQEINSQQPNNSISVTVPVTINGTQSNPQQLMAQLQSRIPALVRQVISDILDEDLQTL